jgi:hypothetical protein
MKTALCTVIIFCCDNVKLLLNDTMKLVFSHFCAVNHKLLTNFIVIKVIADIYHLVSLNLALETIQCLFSVQKAEDETFQPLIPIFLPLPSISSVRT